MLHRVVVAFTFCVATISWAPQEAPASAGSSRDSAVEALAPAERVAQAVSEASWREPIATLRSELGDTVVLEALLEGLERPEGPMAAAPVRWFAFEALVEMLGDSTSDFASVQGRLGQALSDGLSDPATRDRALTGVLHVAPEAQQQVVPELLSLLDDEDAKGDAKVCRVLGKLGAPASDALPKLREVLVAASDVNDKEALQRRAAAAEARVTLTLDLSEDVELYASLDRAGQRAVGPMLALRLASMGVPPGAEEPHLALASLYLDWLERGDLSTPDSAWAWLGLSRLVSDETEPSIRDRARQLLEATAGREGPMAVMATHILDPPETPCHVTEAPPTDARMELLFRPKSNLLTAAQTPRGLLAVSSTVRDLTPVDFGPEASTLFVWDVAQGTLLQRIDDIRGHVVAAELARDGSRLVAGTRGSPPSRPADGLVVSSLDGTPGVVVIAGHEAGVRLLRMTADGQHALTSSDDGTVRWSDLAAATSQVVSTSAAPATPTALALRDGRRFAIGAGDLSLRLYDGETLAELAAGTSRDPNRPEPEEGSGYVHGHPWLPTAAAFLADGERLVVGDATGRLMIWDPGSAEPPALLAETGVGFAAIVLSPDGQRLLTAHHGTWVNGRPRNPADFTLKLWETGASEPSTTLTGAWAPQSVVGFVDEGQRVLGLSDAALRLWRPEGR